MNENQTLPILDVLIHESNEKIEFSVYRKPTTTDRYITRDSFYTYKNKIAAFHSSIYRLCRLPLFVSHYKNEYNRIVEIARINGFDQSLVDKLTRKHHSPLYSSKIRKQLQNKNIWCQHKTIQQLPIVCKIPLKMPI